MREVMPATKGTGTNDDASMTNEEGGAVDISLEFNALVKKLCDEKLTDTAAVKGPITAWRLKHLSRTDDPQMLAFFSDALPSVIARHIQHEENRRVAEKKTVVWTVMLTLFDTLSDYSALWVLYDEGSRYATPMVVILLVSMAFQAISTHFNSKEGPVAMVASLLGLKPVFDGIHIVFEFPPRPGALQSTAAFGFTRVIETASESIPFAIIQALALLEKQSLAQWFSFAISVANIAHAVASVDYSFDTSTHYRDIEPLLYGCYLPGARGDGLFGATTTFALGYVIAKLVAMAMLGTVSGTALACVLVGECVGTLLLRFAIGNWRWYNRGGDSTILSLVFHFFSSYPVMLAAPFPVFRHPLFLSPLLYSGYITWSLFAANPLMLALAFHFDDEPAGMSQRVVWGVLGSATALSVLATLAAFVLMESSFRSTFYRHRTMATHVREHYWMRETKWDRTPVISNDDLDAVRAQTLSNYATAYWPTDFARQWVREGWARWLSNPPVWFTEQWRALIPEEWFDGDEDDDSVIVPMSTQEANFRRAIDQTPPWNLNRRDLEIYFNDHFVDYPSLSLAESEKKKHRHLAHHLVSGAGGVGFLERYCASDTKKAPWVQILNTADGKPLRVDEECLKQLGSFLCSKGLSFYYRLYAASVSLSPLHEYTLVKPMEQHEHMELLLCRNRQTKQLAALSLGSSDYFPVTQSGIQGVCETSEFVASIYQWGPSGPVVFLFGEHCGGGPVTARIKAGVGVEDSEEFCRLAFQLVQGVSDIHRAGLVHMDVKVGSTILFCNYRFFL